MDARVCRDFFQLPPVAKGAGLFKDVQASDDADARSQQSVRARNLWVAVNNVVVLKQNERQKQQQGFAHLLNRFRDGTFTDEDLNTINARFTTEEALDALKLPANTLYLASTRAAVAAINASQLTRGIPASEIHHIYAQHVVKKDVVTRPAAKGPKAADGPLADTADHGAGGAGAGSGSSAEHPAPPRPCDHGEDVTCDVCQDRVITEEIQRRAVAAAGEGVLMDAAPAMEDDNVTPFPEWAKTRWRLLHHTDDKSRKKLAPKLQLRVGARVMLTTNLNVSAGLCNGATGRVVAFIYGTQGKIASSMSSKQAARVDGGYQTPTVLVQFDEEYYKGAFAGMARVLPITPMKEVFSFMGHRWERTMVPLALSYGMTV
jgi:hypothetical protein